MANNISDRSVLYNGKVITYRLERKRVKNLNMRIKRDGKIFVSANSRISAVRIDEFVVSKGDFILSALERFAAIRANEPVKKQYIDGEIFYVLGNEYRLKIIKDTKDAAEYEEDHILLHVKDIGNIEKRKTLLDKFFTEQCKLVFGEVMAEIYPKFAVIGIEMPEMRVRSMKSRWGSCLVMKKVITLNKKLLEHPIICIEYVVMHEFCHFLHPNHSKRFYALLTKMMPDWKTRKTILNENRRTNIC